ncbi:hypothetical protein EFY79_15750 [Hanamia caeni]|jgi:hypothetical protein|uniref:Outer membrane protein beta-barrel domain-containing protein n=1 Tax=Hanamia caeni TaxID=2294116 RepID=A0A3M9N9Y8_9BACT|nr:hypothetical protein [Hanamia caeni]RNI34622.1 hypothetical protein EFY79_15750 [Hanamia caeni]
MKPIFFITIALLITTSSFAQLEKGTWLVGGSGSFYTNDRTNTTPTNFIKYKDVNLDLSASIGYFLKDKLSIGLRPDMTWEKSHWTQASPGISGAIGHGFRYKIGPFARYYFLSNERQFNLLSDICYQFGTNFVTGGDKGKYKSFSLMSGMEVFFNSTAGLEILLGYAHNLVTIDNSPSDQINTRNGFQISVGFQLHLIKD